MLLLPTIALLCLWSQPFQVIGNVDGSDLQNSKHAVRFNLGTHGSECWFDASAFSGYGKALIRNSIFSL